MVPNVAENLRLDATLNGIDDSLICLVRYDQVQVIDLHTLALADSC